MSKRGKIIGIIAGAMALVFVVVFAVSLSRPSEDTHNATATSGIYEFSQGEEKTNTTDGPAYVPPVVLSFIGDCIIGSESGSDHEGGFTWYAQQKPHEYFFSEVYEELSKDTFTLANVENVITDRNLEKTYKDYDPAFWFKAPTKDTDILTKGSVEVAGIVNNHTMDYGQEGYDDTKKALLDEGLMVGEDCVPLYLEANGIKIGVVYAQLWASYHLSYVEDALKEMDGKCDYKIVFFHGGEEGVHEPDSYKVDCCRKLASQGLCDLIVGSHPHVLQPMEIVNNVPIVYSLGNFCYSASNYPENKTIIFQILLTQDEGQIHTSTRIIPCYVYTGDRNNWQPDIVENPQNYADIMDIMNTPVEGVYYPPVEETLPAPEYVPETEAPSPETQAPTTEYDAEYGENDSSGTTEGSEDSEYPDEYQSEKPPIPTYYF